MIRRITVLLVAALVVATCSSSTNHDTEPAIHGDGIATIPSMLDGKDLVDIDRADEPDDQWFRGIAADTEVVLLGPELAARDRFVVWTAPPTNDLPPMTSASHPSADAKLETVSPNAWGCGGQYLSFRAAPDVAINIAQVAPGRVDLLRGVATNLRLTNGHIDTSALIGGLAEYGRLPAGWLHVSTGSRVRIFRGDTFVVRRVTARERRIIAALRCPHPMTEMTPPASTNIGPTLRPSTFHEHGRTIRTGIIRSDVAVALVEGQPGVAVFWDYNCCRVPTASDLVQRALRTGTVSAR